MLHCARHQGDKKEPEVEDIQSSNSIKGEKTEELPLPFSEDCCGNCKALFKCECKTIPKLFTSAKEINEIQIHR